jgi:hypothetical protein
MAIKCPIGIISPCYCDYCLSLNTKDWDELHATEEDD